MKILLNQLKNISNKTATEIAKKKKLEDAASKFESMFISMFLKEAMPSDGGGDSILFGKSNARSIYKDMLNEAISENLGKQGAFGVKDLILNEYKNVYGTTKNSNIKKIADFLDGDFRVSSPFGLRTDPFTKKITFHKGIDLAATEGTIINSPINSKVLFAGTLKGYGNCIKLRTEDGKTFVFGHLKEIDIKEGDTISKGMRIGTVGSTGRSTGPHLHFEIRDKNNKAFDPRTMFIFNENYASRRQK